MDIIKKETQWKQLDWFWSILTNYKNGNFSKSDVLDSFNKLDYDAKIWCYHTIKKKSYVQLKEQLKENINHHFLDILNVLKKKYHVEVSFIHKSPLIYEIECTVKFQYLDYILYENRIIKMRIGKGSLFPIEYKDEIEKVLKELSNAKSHGDNILKHIKSISTLPYIKSITPYSHWATKHYCLHDLDFNILYQDNIHNHFIKEVIGKDRINANILTEINIENCFKIHKKKVLEKLEDEFIKSCLKNDIEYQSIIKKLTKLCEQTLNLKLRVTNEGREISLLDDYKRVRWHNFSKSTDIFGKFEKKIFKKFYEYIELSIKKNSKRAFRIKESTRIIQKYIDLINSCKNQHWKLIKKDQYLELSFIEKGKYIDSIYITINYGGEIKNLDIQLKRKIYKSMKKIINTPHYDYRIMEVK